MDTGVTIVDVIEKRGVHECYRLDFVTFGLTVVIICWRVSNPIKCLHGYHKIPYSYCTDEALTTPLTEKQTFTDNEPFQHKL